MCVLSDELKQPIITQEAFEKCWVHSPLQAAARRLFYIAIHQMSLLSLLYLATCMSKPTWIVHRMENAVLHFGGIQRHLLSF